MSDMQEPKHRWPTIESLQAVSICQSYRWNGAKNKALTELDITKHSY